MTERTIEMFRNGLRVTVAMFLTADTEDRGAALEAIAMSIPLGAAMAVKAMDCRTGEDDRPALTIELVPRILHEDAAEMLDLAKQAITMAVREILEINPDGIVWTGFSNVSDIDPHESQLSLEGMSLPQQNIILPRG